MFFNKWSRLIVLLVFIGLLSACTLPASAPPTVSDEEMATRVAKVLTEMPSPTSALPTAELPPLSTAEPIVNTATPGEVVVEPTMDLNEEVTAAPTQEQATATPLPSPTATNVATTPTAGLTLVPSFTPPPDDPRSKLGNPDWTDEMNDDTYWPTGTDKYTSIDFKDGYLNLTGLSGIDGWRLASSKKLNNFYLEITVKTGTCSGNDRYGLMFRVPVLSDANKGYLFGFTCDGKYSLREWDATIGDNGQMTNHVNWTSSSTIQAGSNKTNTMGIMAVGDRLILYANGALLTEVKDGTFTEGYFGLFVGARETENFTISVDKLSYWENPTP